MSCYENIYIADVPNPEQYGADLDAIAEVAEFVRSNLRLVGEENQGRQHKELVIPNDPDGSRIDYYYNPNVDRCGVPLELWEFTKKDETLGELSNRFATQEDAGFDVEYYDGPQTSEFLADRVHTMADIARMALESTYPPDIA
jgi:hypothetical protein